VKQVAQELGVRYVLEGSVRKAGNRVRITGQLIDTTTGAHIWADLFDGALDDIFELQDQVASNVAGAIEPKLRQTEIERASRKPTANLTAYDLYLRALAQSYRFTEEGLAEAVVLTRQALALDPSYAPAAAMVGWCRALQRVQGWGALSDQDIGEACRLARQALEAERDDAETIWQAARTLFYLAGEAAMAAAAFDRAVALNPNAAHAWLFRGNIHALRNQPEAAIEAIERARRLSPFDPLDFGIVVIVWLNAALLLAASPVALGVPQLLASGGHSRATASQASGVLALLRLPLYRNMVLLAALILGSHAMHDSFAMIRWSRAGISPGASGILWSLSVAAEVVVFVVVGRPLLDRIGPAGAAVLSAGAGVVRWAVMAETAWLPALALIEPLHGLTFALLHLTCMRLLAQCVPRHLEATALTIYGTVGIGIATALLTLACGPIFERFGAHGFWAMAALCAAAMPLTLTLREPMAGSR